MWIGVATFRGHEPFPLDMLRVDRCFPNTGKDTLAISNSIIMGQTTDVTVRIVSASRVGADFSIVRWNSFGWSLVGNIVHTKFTE